MRLLTIDGDEDNAFSLRGLLEILQLDLLLQDEVLQPKSHSLSWRLELMGAIKDGVMKIYSVQRDFVGLAPLVMVRSSSIIKSLTCILSTSQSPIPPHSPVPFSPPNTPSCHGPSCPPCHPSRRGL